MAFDPNSLIGKVRLLTADLDTDAPLVSDDYLQGYLALNGDNVLLAAADVLDAIATSEVLVAKKIRTQDLSTDGPAVAAELRAQADKLRVRSEAEAGSFEFIPFGAGNLLEGEEYRL